MGTSSRRSASTGSSKRVSFTDSAGSVGRAAWAEQRRKCEAAQARRQRAETQEASAARAASSTQMTAEETPAVRGRSVDKEKEADRSRVREPIRDVEAQARAALKAEFDGLWRQTVTEGPRGVQPIGLLWGVYEAREAQDRLVEILRSVDGVAAYIMLLCFTYDRPDIHAEILLAAERMPGRVCVCMDRAMTLSRRTVQMLPMAKELNARGVRVRLVRGGSCYTDMQEVGRKGGWPGILHAKAALTHERAMIGSTNWTTSSRGNKESSVEVTLVASKHEELHAKFEAWANEGVTIQEAEQADEESRSVSPMRMITQCSGRSWPQVM